MPVRRTRLRAGPEGGRPTEGSGCAGCQRRGSVIPVLCRLVVTSRGSTGVRRRGGVAHEELPLATVPGPGSWLIRPTLGSGGLALAPPLSGWQGDGEGDSPPPTRLQVLEMLILVLQQCHKESEDRWKRLSRQVADILLPMLAKQQVGPRGG